MGVPTQRVQKLGNFDLATDDPSHYTDKNTFIMQKREWPDTPYPAGADQDSIPGGYLPQSGGPQGGPGSSRASTQDTTPGVKELQAHLKHIHATAARMCKKAGIPDVCAEYKESLLENIVDNLSSKDLNCRVCKKSFSTVGNLRSHIKGKHLHKTAHFCSICKSYFGEASSLREHMKKHDAKAKKFRCSKCPKEFVSQAKLDDHLVSHGGKNFTCEFCGKHSYKHFRGLKDHYNKCPKHPEFDPSRRFNCKFCTRNYADDRSLRRHYRDSHPKENPDLPQ